MSTYREHDFRPGLPVPAPAGEPVPVEAAHVFPGVWVHVTGSTPDGDPVDVRGLVAADPHDLGDAVALLIRDYTTRRDVAVIADLVELVDDPADHEDRAEHALAPIFAGTDAARADVLVCPPHITGRARYDLTNWVPETFEDVPAADLRALEGAPDVLITAVHWS